VQALPQAAFFLFLEASVGGVIALFYVHLRGEVPRGFTLFTGWGLAISGALAFWLAAVFPPTTTITLSPQARFWFDAQRTLGAVYLVLLVVYLVALHLGRQAVLQLLGPLVPLLGLGALWCAALVQPSAQLAGIGAPLAELLGAMALGSALVGLSLGHWYLVSPGLATAPLIRLIFLGFGALVGQTVLLPLLLFLPGAAGVQALFSDYPLFLVVRMFFGLGLPLAIALMAWRTARIRSLDSATGLLYVLTALVLAGEIAARTLYFLTGVAT
jgi:hypothetical protein